MEVKNEQQQKEEFLQKSAQRCQVIDANLRYKVSVVATLVAKLQWLATSGKLTEYEEKKIKEELEKLEGQLKI